MPDLANRSQHESELAAAVWLILSDEANQPAHDWQAMERRLSDAMQEPLAATFEQSAVAIWLILSDDPVIPSAELVRIAGEARAWAVSTSATIAGSLRANMQAEAAAGAPPSTTFSRGRADTVAVTETTRAASAGERSERRRFDAAGLRTVAYWVTERDSRVCPICRPLDSQREEFWQNEFPGGPPAHPRCRCYLRYEVAGTSNN